MYFENITFNLETKHFFASSKMDEYLNYDYVFSFPFDMVEHLYSNSDYKLYICRGADIKEQDIYIIHNKNSDSENRIGSIVPLQALNSLEHGKIKSYNIRYYYCIFEKILKNEFEFFCDVNHPRIEKDIYTFEDFFGKDCVAILMRNEYSFDDFIISLHMYGYFFADVNNISKEKILIPRPPSEKIVIYKNLHSNYFLELYKSNLLILDQHHLTTFHLLYQIIEMLIEKIYSLEIKDIVNTISSGDFNPSNIKDDMSNMSKELYRINLLFSNYLVLFPALQPYWELTTSELDNKINTYLQKNEIKITKTGLPDILYLLRNSIVHSYSKLEDKEDITTINSSFQKLVSLILIRYKHVENDIAQPILFHI